jgi:C1A family cysteine protease
MAKSSFILATVLFGLIYFAACGQTFQQQQDVVLFYNIFKDWIAKYNKQYGIEEMATRFYTWKNNYDHVQEHNAQGLSYKLEMNHFADMTPEEFSALHLGLNVYLDARNNKKSTNSSQVEKKDTLPKSVDWRKSGAVTGVKNQGQCGGCWSFSASGALEGLHAIKNKKLTSFSEQQLIDCSYGYGNQGCDGGLMDAAFEYTQTHGIQPESTYEFTGTNGTCKQENDKVVFKNTGFGDVTQNDSLALKEAVHRQPVSVGIEASSMTVQLFQSGVIDSGCGTDLDHGVLVVGYNVDSNGQEYWIVKNSWGPSWGLEGYFHIATGSQNDGAGVCGINMIASYPTA